LGKSAQRYEHPKQYIGTYIEYFAMENLCREIQFIIWTRSLRTFPPIFCTFVLRDFRFLWCKSREEAEVENMDLLSPRTAHLLFGSVQPSQPSLLTCTRDLKSRVCVSGIKYENFDWTERSKNEKTSYWLVRCDSRVDSIKCYSWGKFNKSLFMFGGDYIHTYVCTRWPIFIVIQFYNKWICMYTFL
jgi:hypothetical protein